MSSFDYETHLTNRALVKVIDNIFATRSPNIDATAEEISNYEEAKQILSTLKDKAGEGPLPRTKFKFKINQNLTVSQVLKKIEELQISDVQSEILNLKGEIFYRSTLENNPAQGGENIGEISAGEARIRGAMARGYDGQGEERDRQRGGFWKRAAKEHDTDIYVESSLISFLDSEKKIIDWECTLNNLNRIGEERAYTSNNY